MKREEKVTTDTDKCIHCGRCTENCLFLKKYQQDIGTVEKIPELAYHCFLCGRCTEVCPKGIDGREVLLNMRRQQVRENQGKMAEKGYGILLTEKQNYMFRNYRHPGKSALFPGCNFTGTYPETTKYLIRLLKEQADIGMIYDCCGKPVAEMGLEKQEEKMIDRLNMRLKQLGIEELIMVCPNCLDYLEGKLQVRMVSIYEKLVELGIGKPIQEDIQILRPCPDRYESRWLKWMEPYLKGAVAPIETVQCCGLGGCAGVKEPELARKMPAELRAYDHIYTYCGSCAGQLARNGCREVSHILPEILGVKEKPDVKKSLLNRIKMKFW